MRGVDPLPYSIVDHHYQDVPPGYFQTLVAVALAMYSFRLLAAILTAQISSGVGNECVLAHVIAALKKLILIFPGL